MHKVIPEHGHLLQNILAHLGHAGKEEEGEEARDGAEAARQRAEVERVGPVEAFEVGTDFVAAGKSGGWVRR